MDLFVLWHSANDSDHNLWLFIVEGERFHPYPDTLASSGSFTIEGWKTLSDEKLSKEIATRYGIWSENENVMPDKYRLRKAKGLELGQFYKRIWRPVWKNNNEPPKEKARFQSAGQLKNLTIEIDQITRVLEPNASNLNSFGLKIRDVIIALCTEIECILQEMMRANGYHRCRYSTNDYVKCKTPLLLERFAIEFTKWPNIGQQLRPFVTWNAEQPTGSLGFYDAYNKIKHSRESQLELATLKHLLDAYAATLIVNLACFGGDGIEELFIFGGTKVSWPSYRIDEMYLAPAHNETDWQSRTFSL